MAFNYVDSTQKIGYIFRATITECKELLQNSDCMIGNFSCGNVSVSYSQLV